MLACQYVVLHVDADSKVEQLSVPFPVQRMYSKLLGVEPAKGKAVHYNIRSLLPYTMVLLRATNWWSLQHVELGGALSVHACPNAALTCLCIHPARVVVSLCARPSKWAHIGKASNGCQWCI